MVIDLEVASKDVEVPEDEQKAMIFGLRSLCGDVADALRGVLVMLADPKCPSCGGTEKIHGPKCQMVGASPYFMTGWVKETPETTAPNNGGEVVS